jgi:hypothetical protein
LAAQDEPTGVGINVPGDPEVDTRLFSRYLGQTAKEFVRSTVTGM